MNGIFSNNINVVSMDSDQVKEIAYLRSKILGTLEEVKKTGEFSFEIRSVVPPYKLSADKKYFLSKELWLN